MDNKNIESRYTIEYIYPDSDSINQGETSSNLGLKLLLSVSITGLVALGLLTSLQYPFASKNGSIEATVDVKQPVSQPIPDNNIETNVILSANEKNNKTNATTAKLANKVTVTNSGATISTIAKEEETTIADEIMPKAVKAEVTSNIDKTIDNQLIEKLKDVSKQLTLEKEKNKQLSSMIDIKKNKNKELSQMLTEALNKASNADKRYLDALTLLEKSDATKKEHITTNNIITTEVAQKVPIKSESSKNTNTITQQNATQSQINEIIETLKKGDSDQSNDESTSLATPLDTEEATIVEVAKSVKAPVSQIDAIVAAMGGVNLSPTRESTTPRAEPTITLQANEINTNKQKEADLLYVKLQKQINDLVVTNEIQTSDYKTALKTESATRSNAVRSITVRKGDTLWDIAKRAYGNGSFYKKILEANPEVTKKGKIYLREGQVIRVPI